MKKICFVTAARSEYGLMKWLMKEIERSDEFELQIIATGGHLLKEQGYTIDRIRKDGFTVNEVVDPDLMFDSTKEIAVSMGRIAERIADSFERLKPDYVAVLGDRYELLPICSTAFMMGIPIIHISGGDETEGAIDNGIRNAVTMLATYHFPGVFESAERIRRMRGCSDNIWVVGEPGLDSFKREEMLDRNEISKRLGLLRDKKWALMTYHPETRDNMENDLAAVENCFKALSDHDELQVIMTYANSDCGGSDINKLIEKKAADDNGKFKCIPSLGGQMYLSLMKEASLMIGNSSSGIVEAPSVRVPVVNIGNRQKGRHLCSNIIQCKKELDDIKTAVNKALTDEIDEIDLDYWGEGNTSEKIYEILRKTL